jgi:hypothetical protein
VEVINQKVIDVSYLTIQNFVLRVNLVNPALSNQPYRQFAFEVLIIANAKVGYFTDL